MTRRGPTEAQVDEAKRVLRADYYTDVRNLVEHAKEAIKKGEIEDREALDEWFHQTIDDHQRVIYTGQAMHGLIASDNTDVAETEGLVDHEIDWSVRMYAAMRRDVQELADAEGLEDLLGRAGRKRRRA